METIFEYICYGICYVLTIITYIALMIMPFYIIGALIYGIYKDIFGNNKK